MMMMPNSADFPFKYKKFDFTLQNTMFLIKGKQLVMNTYDQSLIITLYYSSEIRSLLRNHFLCKDGRKYEH